MGYELDGASANKVLAGMIGVGHGPLPESDRVFVVKANEVVLGPNFKFLTAVRRLKPLGGVHVSPDVVFQWAPYSSASYYRVRVEDCGWKPYGGLLWRSQDVGVITSPSDNWVFGTSTTAKWLEITLKRDHYYTWQVSAHDQHDRVLSRSNSSVYFTYDELDFRVRKK